MITAIALLIVGLAMPSYGQTSPSKTTIPSGKKPAMLDKTKVPKAVNENFIMEFPTVAKESWYGYPKYDFNTEWYGYNPYLVENVNPEFYIVEFTKDKVHHKVVYSKEGKKIAVHKKVSTMLPVAITDAIKKGAYSTWKIESENEEIFKDNESDKLKVYNVKVEKGDMKHHLFYSTDGTLLEDKTIK
jgi:hypothetical protein